MVAATNLLDPLAWCIILFALGCGLAVLEVFFPSGGILGFSSAVLVIGSIVWAFTQRGLAVGTTFALSAAIGLPILLSLAVKYWPRTRLGRAVLGDTPTEEDLVPQDQRHALVGRIGMTQTKMLPSGAIEVEGRSYSAVTRGVALDAGVPVKVIEVKGNRIVVRPVSADQALASEPDVPDLSQPIEDLDLDSFEDPLAEAPES